MALSDRLRKIFGIQGVPRVDPQLAARLRERGREREIRGLEQPLPPRQEGLVARVGEGLTPEQQRRAEETIQRQTRLGQQELTERQRRGPLGFLEPKPRLEARVGEGLPAEEKKKAREIIAKEPTAPLKGTGILGILSEFQQEQTISPSDQELLALNPDVIKKNPELKKLRNEALVNIAGALETGPLRKIKKPLLEKIGKNISKKVSKSVLEKGVGKIKAKPIKDIAERISEKAQKVFDITGFKRLDADGLVEDVLTTKKGKVFADNIRLERLGSTQDVEDIITETAAANKFMIDEAKRGIITNTKTKELADNLGLTTEQLLKRRKGKAFNAEELVAANDLLATHSKQLSDIKNKILKGDNTDETLLAFRNALDKQAALQASVSGAIAESGRALQANRVLARQMPTEQTAQKAMLDALGGRDVSEELARRMADTPLDDVRAVNKFVRDVTTVPVKDKVYEFWINSILSNPVTHMRNVIGNSFMAMTKPVVRLGEAVAETRKGLGREILFGEAPRQVVGMMSGLDEGIRKALYVMREGVTPLQATKLETRGVPAIKGMFGEIVRTPTKFLTAADEFFKAVNTSGEMTAQAYRKAVKEGTKGAARTNRIAELLENPTKDMVQEVDTKVLESVFQQPLGRTGTSIMNLRNKVPGLKYIIPFVKTPTNILKEAGALSPVGFIKSAKTLAKEGINSKQLSTDVAKATIGSMVAAHFTNKALQGSITGSAPKNTAERDAFFRSGKQPFSVLIGDKWVSYKGLEPLSTVVGPVADMVELINEGEDPTETAARIVSLIGSNLNDKTFMRGLSDLTNAISDPERFGTRWITNAISGFVPQALSPIARTFDPTLRDIKGENLAESLLNAIKAKTPGLSQTLDPRRNVFGEEIKFESSAFTPFPITTPKGDAVDEELDRLGITVNFPGRTKLKTKLSPAQYNKFLEASGQIVKAVLDQTIKTPAYQNASDIQKEKMIDKITSEVRSKVTERMVGDILLKKNKIKVEDENVKKLFNSIMQEVVNTPEYKKAGEEQRNSIVKRIYAGVLDKFSQ